MDFQLITKYFTPTNILDIGIHEAQFYRAAKAYFPHASFFLIEGNTICEPLIRNLNVPYLIRVLGKENGTGIFYKSKEYLACSGESLYKEVTPHFSGESLIEEHVTIHTLDSIFSEPNFDFIKIDTQGSEVDIIKGGINVVSKAKGVLLETSVEKYNEGAPLYGEVVEYMDSIGFEEKECLAINHHTTSFNLTIHQRDILFINRNA